MTFTCKCDVWNRQQKVWTGCWKKLEKLLNAYACEWELGKKRGKWGILLESMLIVILDENFSLHHTTLYLLDEFLLLHKKNDFFFWWFMNHFSHDEPHLLAPADDDFLKFFKKHFDEGELNRCVIRQEENFFRILNIAISPNSLNSNST